ncbi:Aste57867_8966 [Aphanomyces stellatus]|uniref:Aste57867_8966 protein n=1 Tax=Aphanomyces stellatus TaxID=120398 RepID=A0A485KLM1_9STRA|nr:hypothetical protein As57867_008931 [Aphanomyces stellatus]VFT85850.1 Aste57867_8966 [Aphanomyces stellatus]
MASPRSKSEMSPKRSPMDDINDEDQLIPRHRSLSHSDHVPGEHKHEPLPELDADTDVEIVKPAKPHHPITYRPDIDGLRCLAVVPVIIFHGYPALLPGGYIGVDIFFVISGYLISSILFKEHARGKFTYTDFYSRRVRRIFPTLVLVLSFTLVGACMWLYSKHLKACAETLLAGGFFGANIQLMLLKQAYGDATLSATNPLLHLWSLGVEEQFYIFWPMFASLVVRVQPKFAVFLQLLMIAASFACNIAFLGYHGDNKYSFYFPLSRFWQMAIGGLLAYINLPKTDLPWKSSTAPTPIRSAVISFLGLGAIVYAMSVLDETVAFPGYWALCPTLGAACLIFAGPNAPFNKYILGTTPFIFVGQVSYALYLWHWPLLVFAKVKFPNAALRPWYYEPYATLGAAFLLSIATLYLLENNLRRRKSPMVVPVLSSLLVVVLAAAAFVDQAPDVFSSPTRMALSAAHANNGAMVVPESDLNWSQPPRLAEPTVAKIRAASSDRFASFGFNFTGWTQISEDPIEHSLKVLNQNGTGPAVFAMGDSHISMTAPRFVRLFEIAQQQNKSFPVVYLRGRNAQLPMTCTDAHDTDMAFIKKTKPKVVFYNGNWIQFLRGEGTGPKAENPKCCHFDYTPCPEQSKEDVIELVNRFQAEMTDLVASGIKVFAATVNPEGDEFDGFNMLNGDTIGAIAPIKRSTFRKKYEFTISLIEKAIKAANATLIDFSDNQCMNDVCEVVSTREGEPVFVDRNHIRPYFVRNYLTSIDQIVEAALN